MESSKVRFREWGYGKIAECLYEFLITDDYQASISMKLFTEKCHFSATTSIVSLSEEEQRLVDLFVEKKIKPRMQKKPAYEDRIVPYEGFSIESNDVSIDDDYLIRYQLMGIKDIIQGNHPEISVESVISIYNDLCSKIGENTYVFQKQ